jgi:uncharacterized protein (DUF2132 family)
MKGGYAALKKWNSYKKESRPKSMALSCFRRDNGIRSSLMFLRNGASVHH